MRGELPSNHLTRTQEPTMFSIGETTLAMQQLLDRFVKGDQQAKNDLINRAYDRLIIVARKLLGSFPDVRLEEETAGVLSEAYLRLRKSLDDVKPETVRQFFGLAALQIRRVLLDKIWELRGGRGENPPKFVSMDAQRAGDTSAGGDDLADTGIDSARQNLAIDFLEAIEKLADEEHEVVELLFFHGYTQPEAGEIIGVHEDRVKRRWSRARVRLAEKLAAFA
jgi:RNA polymerase sigma-70 factor (ECF subfamily)